MNTLLQHARLLGLIGYPLSHSFSKDYFSRKFEKEGIQDCFYENFPIRSVDQMPALFRDHPNLIGLNVTIPYKEAVIPLLDELAPGAEAVGAVNTIKRLPDGRLKGFNTDVYGFQWSLEKEIAANHLTIESALVLGTGGAAKAVCYVLEKMGIAYQLVSRRPGKAALTYEEIDEAILLKNRLLVNTTPLGMSPKTDTFPILPYELLTDGHLLYDLVYNPAETLFLQKGKAAGAATKNGLDMLHLQAEKAWEIWTSH